jgi:rare lipoprotein A
MEGGGSSVGTRSPSNHPEEGLPAAAGYAVQLFASASLATAQERSRALARHFGEPCGVVEEGGVYKVRLGPFVDREAAEPVRRRAFDLGFTDAFIVPPRAVPREGGR